MIKINLCPVDELENQYWWVPDAAAFAIVALSAFFGVQYYIGLVEEEIAAVRADVVDLNQKHESLKPDLIRFKDLGSDIEELNIKIDALKKITVSRISKYRPIIVLEHLHNLKPEGVWFDEVSIKEDFTFSVKGKAFDNILVSEFMGNLRSTATQEDDKSDIRTQIYFEELGLVTTKVTGKNGNGDFPDISEVPEYEIEGVIKERGVDLVPEEPIEEEPDATQQSEPPVEVSRSSQPIKKVGM